MKPRPASANSTKKSTVSWGEAPYKPSSSISSSKKTDQKPTSHENRSHSGSLRKKEISQLETFIKTRTQQVDSEIEEMRNKLKKSNKLGHSLLPDPNASAALNADILSQQSGSKGGMAVHGSGLGRVNLQSQRILNQSKTATAYLSHDVDSFRKLSSISEHDRAHGDDNTMAQLATLLATLKLKCEDAGLSNIELRELLLPSDLMEPGDFKLPLRETTSVLQTDLLMPLSNFDQRLILEMYGDDRGFIDIRMLLSDAGLWHEVPNRDNVVAPRDLTSTADRLAEKFQTSSPKKEKRISAAEDEDLSKSGIFKQQTKQVLHDTNSHVENLHDLHELIMEEREWDDLTNSAASNLQQSRGMKGLLDTSKDLDMSFSSVSAKKMPTSSSSSSSSSTVPSLLPPQVSGSPHASNEDNTNKYPASRDKLRDLLASSGMNDDLDRLRLLAEENQRLKKEISAFDSEFFEELEDLKFRYAKLQEVVGEDPLAPSVYGKSKLAPPLHEDEDAEKASENGGSKLPLSRLAWSVRNSMRAMDRASDDSPLVQGPRIASAYTYAPGAPSSLGDRNMSSGTHHRSLSATRTEYEGFARDNLDDSVYGRKTILQASLNDRNHPYAMPSKKSGVILDGGIHGLGAGKYSAIPNDQGGNFANLCERRLVFELANQPNPYNATNELLAKVEDVAQRNAVTAKDPKKIEGLFISVQQLMEIMLQSRLSLSPQEVEVLASGFASDGNGSIDAAEFCDMVRTLLYNLTGSHFLQQSTALSASSSSSSSQRAARRPATGIGMAELKQNDFTAAEEPAEFDTNRDGGKFIHPILRNPEYRHLVTDLCETMVTYDRQAVLGTSKNFMQTLLKPFVEEDYKGSGVLPFVDFVSVVKSLGSMFSYHEYKLLAAPFVVDSPPAESAYPSSNLNHIKSFREAKLSGALRGKAMTQGIMGDFLAEHHLQDIVQRPMDLQDVDHRVQDSSLVEYPAFVKMIVDELEAMLERKGGLDLGSHSRLPWVLKEMEFVDVLITQLENMRATARRKVLITLQYALQNADTKQSGELDGFALLTTLLNCGFRLQRYHRVQLLQAAEEFGGTLEYSRLILTLLQTAIDWTHHERDIVLKILRAMGVTVAERRKWLAKLKKLLLQSASKTKLKLIARRQSTSSINHARKSSTVRTVEHSVSLDKNGETEEDLLAWSQRLSSTPSQSSLDHDDSTSAGVVMIAPSAFLHVLRDCHVQLSPEEEATLLDCLDTERIARQEASAFAPVHHTTQQKNTSRLLFGTGGNGQDGFNVPMVDFQSFLTFCSRHCGSWVDTKPSLQTALFEAVSTLHNPLQALHEFVTLLHSFDEKKIGFISQRAFLICGHRARLLANLSESHLQELTEILAVDGAGEVEYRSIVMQLRGMCSGLTMKQMETAHTSLLQQLLRNASDHTETLRPLRNWLIHHSDLQALILTTREFNGLLREFSVTYRPEDLDLLMMEIGQEVDFQDVASLMSHSKAHLGQATGERRYDSQHRVDQIARTTWVVDTKKFMALCLRSRSSWMMRNPRLAKHLLISLKRLHFKRHVANNDSNKRHAASQSMDTMTLTIDGTEMSALEEVMGRIRAFASDEFRPSAISSNGGLSSFQTPTNTADESKQVTLIEADIFVYIVTNLGIELSKEDIQFLCDASDPYPEARFINPDLLYDILHIEWLQTQHQQNKEDEDYNGPSNMKPGQQHEVTEKDIADFTEAAVYALDHLQQLVRKTQVQCGRSIEDWTADLRCLFAGFDPHQQGFLTYEDFLLALSLLNVKISAELLKDIPYVGKNRGYVQYPKMLDYIIRANAMGAHTKKSKGGDGIPKSGSKSDLLNQLSLQDAEEEEHAKRSLTIHQRNDVLEKEQMNASNGYSSKQPLSPVLALLRVVRKKMCGFIISEANVEEAWLEMLRVFQRFDVTEQKVVSPRDFCLAVSVLLDDDNIVLTKAEWEEIIEYFAVLPDSTESTGKNMKNKSANDSSLSRKRVTINGELAVDYMLFCEMVLDPSEVQKKLQDVKFGRLANTSAAKVERAKDRLSTSAANKSRTDSVDRQRMQAGLADPSPSTSRRQAGTVNKNESVEDRFERASAKYQDSMKQGRQYGGSLGGEAANSNVRNAASSRALGNVEAGSDSYRVARTQGQASRDSAAVRLRAPKSATVTVPSNEIYLAGKGVGSNSARSSSAGRGRFNKTS